MPRYFVDIAYNGNNYFGYQIQNNQVSVQETLEKALSIYLKSAIKTTGSSRTDTGVHALQNICHFDFEKDIDTEDVKYKVNKILPSDIVCNKIYVVDDQKHARFSATHRRYIYKLHTVKDVFNAGQSFFYKYGALDIEAMNKAVNYLFDYKEFDCFSKLHADNKTTICSISLAKWKSSKSGFYEFEVQSNRFLRGMVRAIVGTSILVGRGKISPEDFKNIIINKDMSKADFSPPGNGLYLAEVAY